MAKTKKKYEAIELRKDGCSIRDIAKHIDVSKGTVSLWCRDIVLTPKQIIKLEAKRKEAGLRGSLRAMEIKRRVRMEEEKLLRDKGIKEIGKINRRDLFIAGVAIYWSEGYNYLGDDQVGFTNTNPKMILLMLQWFREICNLSDDRFRFAIRINSRHKNRIKESEKYWSELMNMPLSQFSKTILIKSKSKKIYPKSKPYYGTLRITISRGTKLRREIKGWLAGLALIVD